MRLLSLCLSCLVCLGPVVFGDEYKCTTRSSKCPADGSKCPASSPWFSPDSKSCHAVKDHNHKYYICCKPGSPSPPTPPTPPTPPGPPTSCTSATRDSKCPASAKCPASTPWFSPDSKSCHAVKDHNHYYYICCPDSAGPTPTPPPGPTPPVGPKGVTVDGYKIKVDGADFTVRGVCYSPTPIGQNAATAQPFGDYYTDNYEYLWRRDMPLIQAMGANTLRIYGWDNTKDHTKFLDVAKEFNLKVILSFFMLPATWPILTDENQTAVIEAFSGQVQKYSKHEAVLMWCFGNELNGFWNGYTAQLASYASCTDKCPADPISPGCGCVKDSHSEGCKCMWHAFFTFIGKACNAAKNVMGDRPVPCTTGLADVGGDEDGSGGLVEDMEKLEYTKGKLDLWSVQLYRGKDKHFTDYPVHHKERSTKPLLVTEFGVDAYNDPCGSLLPATTTKAWAMEQMHTTAPDWQKGPHVNTTVMVCNNQADKPPTGSSELTKTAWGPDEATQASWTKTMTETFEKNSAVNGGAVAGACIFEWVDEFWKNSMLNAQYTCNPPWTAATDATFKYTNCTAGAPATPKGTGQGAHRQCPTTDIMKNDVCGSYLQATYDGYMNEGWFGITQPTKSGSCSEYFDVLTLRQAYVELQKIWNPAGTPSKAGDKPYTNCTLPDTPAPAPTPPTPGPNPATPPPRTPPPTQPTPAPPPTGSSGGPNAGGIVIGVLVLLAGIGLVAYGVVRYRQTRTDIAAGAPTTAATEPNSQYQGF